MQAAWRINRSRRAALPLNANLLRRWVAAHEARDAAVPARESMILPSAGFVPLPLDAAPAATASQDIVIEVRRGAATVIVRWSRTAAAECAARPHHAYVFANKSATRIKVSVYDGRLVAGSAPHRLNRGRFVWTDSVDTPRSDSMLIHSAPW